MAYITKNLPPEMGRDGVDVNVRTQVKDQIRHIEKEAVVQIVMAAYLADLRGMKNKSLLTICPHTMRYIKL